MMFSLCRRYKDDHEHGGTQVKGGYMLRYKRRVGQMLSHSEAPGEGEPRDAGRRHLDGTGAPPADAAAGRAPVAADGARLATGSRHRRLDVGQIRRGDELPAPPQIELVMSMPYLRTAFKRPTVRVRPSSTSEICGRSSRPTGYSGGAVGGGAGVMEGRGLVAVIKRQVPLAGQLRHELSWGQGWGWVTLPNGAWSGRLTWSQEGEDFALHALPTMHHTNVSQACSMLDGVTAYEASVYEQALAEYDDSATTSDDWDFGVDCGDFMM